MWWRHLLVASPIIILFSATRARAQREPTAEECHIAAHYSRPGQAVSLPAIRTLSRCRNDGPPALAALWSSPPSDTDALRALAGASFVLRDRRILDAAREAALKPNNSTGVRITAMITLARYLDSTLVVIQISPGAAQPATDGVADGTSPPVDGVQPLPPDARDRILEVLRRLEADPDPVIRATAEGLHRVLTPPRDPVVTQARRAAVPEPVPTDTLRTDPGR